VDLAQELERIAGIAQTLAAEDEQVTGVVPAEPDDGVRVYLCSFERGEERSWLALDASGRPVADRTLVRAAASIAALCELADESAGGGDLSELRAQLVSLRLTESPPGIDEAEEAALALEAAVGSPPRVASPAHLDAVGAATLRLERALGEGASSPFAESMKHALGAVEELQAEIVGRYRLALEG
jgi:hypothetical protein